jgi:hypothetical protein
MKWKKLWESPNCRFVVAMIAVLVCVAHSASAQLETVLHKFTGGATGALPMPLRQAVPAIFMARRTGAGIIRHALTTMAVA